MRFGKGSKVEVLCTKEVSFGAWRCAEIITESGETYKVRCEATNGKSSGKIVDRVPSTAIRPSPPHVEAPVNWATGDVLEVLDNGSWKAATVLKVIEPDHCLVRILGSFEEFKVYVSKTRLRQTWKDDNWVVLGKAYGSSHELANWNNRLDLISCEVPQVYGKENNHCQDSYIVSAKSLKRASPFCSSYFDAYPSKVRAIEDWTRKHRQAAASRSLSTLILEIVDDNSTSVQNSQCDVERESLNGVCSCYLARCSASSESDDSDDIDDNNTDIISVVDSCSINGDRMNFSGNVLAGPVLGPDADADCSDAESFCGRQSEKEDEAVRLDEEEEASRIHKLELNAYRSTVAAIHASGPLTWEREEMLTNLRITLHISLYEHLSEVRNLIASGNPSSLLA